MIKTHIVQPSLILSLTQIRLSSRVHSMMSFPALWHFIDVFQIIINLYYTLNICIHRYFNKAFTIILEYKYDKIR